MNYSEKYYKELFILKETKDFLLEELYNRFKTFPDEYNYKGLKKELNNLNTLFELNRFALSIAQNEEDKDFLTRHLTRIQHGYLFAFCEYIGELPIGSSHIDNTGEEDIPYSYKDAYISSRDALDEIINELRLLEDRQKTVRLEEILRENIYKASFELSNSQIKSYDSEKGSMEIGSKLPQKVLESRIHLHNRFIADLIKDVYLWFDIDVIELITKGRNQKLSEILRVGKMDFSYFEYIKEAIIEEKEGVINNEDLDTIIDNTIRTPRKPKLTKDTQPQLTQHQIMILFRNLQNQRAINSHISNTMLGHCIALLAGFETGDSIRQAYSNDYDEIEGNAKNRKEVVSILEKIVDKLK